MSTGRGPRPTDPGGVPAPEDLPGFEAPEAVLELEPAEQPALAVPERPGRVHLVVVVTRSAEAEDANAAGGALLARYWHPSLRRWTESAFESLEHALHLYVDESGWILRQQQALGAPQAFELIFEARREQFSRPSTEAMLEDVGLTREDVAGMLKRVERDNGG